MKTSMDRIPHPSGEPCRICGGHLLVAFEGVVLGDISVTYGLCESCRSLLLPNPHWLERSYSTRLDPDPDSGVGLRSSLVMSAVKQLVRHRLLQERVKTLDFGTGKGVLLDRLLKRGFDAWGHDPYPHPEHARDRVSPEMPESQFPLITCIEVLEHTLDPRGTLVCLRDALESGGIILLSTEFFDESKHGPNWWYLVPEHGQHVTIFSHAGFDHCVRAAGLHWHGTIPLDGRPFLHVLTNGAVTIGSECLEEISHRVQRKIRFDLLFMRLKNILLLMKNPAKAMKKVMGRLSGTQ